MKSKFDLNLFKAKSIPDFDVPIKNLLDYTKIVVSFFG